MAAQNLPGMGAPIADENRFVTPAWRNFFVSLWNRTGGGTDVVQLGSFVGEIRAYGGSPPPSQWLTCDGSELSRTAYATLYDVLGTSYGIGDGVTTFNLPDFRGRALLGAGSAPGLTARSLGDTGGVESTVLTTTQMPSHTHGVTDPGHLHTITDPGHHHTAVDGTGANATAGTAVGTASSVTGNATTGITIDTATTGVTLANTGGTDPVSVMQPFGVVNYIIRVQ